MEDKFIVVGQNGQTVECDVLFTFDSDSTKKSYVVYTDNTEEADGSVRIFASTYIMDGEKAKLEAVETDEEWEIIEAILETAKEQSRQGNN